MGATMEPGIAVNRVTALALLIDSQLTRAGHEAEDARAEAAARVEAQRRQEEAERAYREQLAREQWSRFDERLHVTSQAVRSEKRRVVSKRVVAGLLVAASTALGLYSGLVARMILPATHSGTISEGYHAGLNGVGHVVSQFVWLPILLGLATWFLASRLPVISLVSVPAIAWVVYSSAPTGLPPGRIGGTVADFVEGLGEFAVIYTLPVALVAGWLIWTSFSTAVGARVAEKRLRVAEETLRSHLSAPPSVARPGEVS